MPTQRAPEVRDSGHFRAFFWLRVFPARPHTSGYPSWVLRKREPLACYECKLMKQNMKNALAYGRAAILGALNGFIFGYLCELAYRVKFNAFMRELGRIADEAGPIVDVWYPWDWWMLPGFFVSIFAIVSLFMHWTRSKRALSKARLWQEIGLISVAVSLLPILVYHYYRVSVFSVGTVLFLFGLAIVLNSLFGGFLQIASD